MRGQKISNTKVVADIVKPRAQVRREEERNARKKKEEKTEVKKNRELRG